MTFEKELNYLKNAWKCFEAELTSWNLKNEAGLIFTMSSDSDVKISYEKNDAEDISSP